MRDKLACSGFVWLPRKNNDYICWGVQWGTVFERKWIEQQKPDELRDPPWVQRLNWVNIAPFEALNIFKMCAWRVWWFFGGSKRTHFCRFKTVALPMWRLVCQCSGARPQSATKCNTQKLRMHFFELSWIIFKLLQEGSPNSSPFALRKVISKKRKEVTWSASLVVVQKFSKTVLQSGENMFMWLCEIICAHSTCLLNRELLGELWPKHLSKEV